MSPHGPHSCATCARQDCHLSFVSRDVAPVAAMTAFVLDEGWPELKRFVAEQRKPGDQLIAPGIMGRDVAGRYEWGGGHAATLATLGRRITMRRVAKARGAVRQAAYLRADEAIARALSQRIDYRAGHLVVQQALLPFLWRDGVLGGRTFDVLMTRYPLAELHARLDATHRLHPDSATIGDFRAPDSLVAAEAEALAEARRVISPHHDIASLFGARGLWLDWDRPQPRPRRGGSRIAFFGPVITRQGAHEVRQLARYMPEPLVVFGAMLEGADFWQDVPVEYRRAGPGDLDDVAAILHPATVTHAPRRLLQAIADGVTVYARPSCGLPPGDFRPFYTFAKLLPNGGIADMVL